MAVHFGNFAKEVIKHKHPKTVDDVVKNLDKFEELWDKKKKKRVLHKVSREAHDALYDRLKQIDDGMDTHNNDQLYDYVSEALIKYFEIADPNIADMAAKFDDAKTKFQFLAQSYDEHIGIRDEDGRVVDEENAHKSIYHLVESLRKDKDGKGQDVKDGVHGVMGENTKSAVDTYANVYIQKGNLIHFHKKDYTKFLEDKHGEKAEELDFATLYMAPKQSVLQAFLKDRGAKKRDHLKPIGIKYK